MNGYTISIVEWHTNCFTANVYSTIHDCYVNEFEGDSPMEVLSKALIWIEEIKENK